MANSAERPRSSPAPLERRRRPRKKISEVTYFDLVDRDNGGLVLNISEDGMLLQSALKVTGQEVSRFRFRLPASDQWIEARAKLVWVGVSGREAGAQFLDLSEDARAKIRDWVADGGLPRSPAEIPGELAASQQTSHEPPTAAPAAAGAAGTPSGSGMQAHDGPPLSFARPKRETSLPLWGLGRVVCWVAIAVVAVFLGLRYSRRLPQLLLLGRLKKAWSSAISPAKAVQSPSANALKRSAAGPAQAHSPGLPPDRIQTSTVAGSPIGGQSATAPFAPEGVGSPLASMVTQTLSPNPTAAEPKPAEIRSLAQTRRHTQSLPQPSGTRSPMYVQAPEPFHEAILVGAPAVGKPPARVVLERQPVSASSLVAVTASRSILVPGSYDATEEVQLGKLVSYVDPAYPVRALAKEVEGTVRVRAFIGRSGHVLKVQLLSGPAVLAPAAVSAIRQWRYAPTLLNGQAIESRADISVFFRLH